MRLLFPVLIVVLAILAGGGAGFMLREPPDDEEEVAVAPPDSLDFARLSNQFVVPVIDRGRVAAMVILSLSIAVDPGNTETVFTQEPRLRDAFLQTLFNHANMGGFDGNYTESGSMTLLRGALRETAQRVLGPVAQDVLVVEIVRQDF
jgi:hypothetical protein